MDKGGVVYMLASHKHGTLYVGVTARFVERMAEHRHDMLPGFTRDYGVKRLVWCEHHEGIEGAIQREKRIKGWNRQWKVNLIAVANGNWDDLAVEMFGFEALPPYDREAITERRRAAQAERHPREGGDPRSQIYRPGGAAIVPHSVTMGPRLRGDDGSGRE